MTREAMLRALVYVGLIAFSILIWWGALNLFMAAGPLPLPVAPGLR
jgi:hypothetical protein